jgi:hypothetical protein
VRALEAARARCQTITRAAGYATNAGDHVIVGELLDLGPDDVTQAIALLLNEDIPGQPMTTVPLEISGLTFADLEEPWLAAEAILGDIRKALETADKTLGGLVKSMSKGSVRPYPRQPGSTVVGVTITYQLTMVDPWGHL